MYIFPFGDQYSKVEKEIILLLVIRQLTKFCICVELTCLENIYNLSPDSFFYLLS